MRREKGFKLVKLFKWISTRPRRARRRRRTRSSSLEHVPAKKTRNPISRVLSHLKRRCFRKPGYVALGQDDPGRPDPGSGIPKGHLAVYVGEKQDETQRYLVPVIYFNHPLFGELLKEAERVYGFNHPGRITIPCGPSQFENVQMRIASAAESDPLHRRRFKTGQRS